MRTRRLTSIAKLGVLIFAQSLGAAAAEQHPNVVLIMTGDQGCGDVRSHGNDKIDMPSTKTA